MPNSTPVFAKGIERSLLLARLQPTLANVEAAAKTALKDNGSPGVVQNLVMLGRVDQAYELLNDPRAFALVRENTDVLFRSFMRSFFFDRRFMPLLRASGLSNSGYQPICGRPFATTRILPTTARPKPAAYFIEKAKRLRFEDMLVVS